MPVSGLFWPGDEGTVRYKMNQTHRDVKEATDCIGLGTKLLDSESRSLT